MEESEHLPAYCEPKVKLTGDIPVEVIPSITKCVVDMTEEEREKHFKEKGEEQYKHYLVAKESGAYSRCRKTDWCKVEREKKEKEENKKKELIETLTSRNQILENHARTITRELENYKKLTEARFEKLTNLFLSMNK